MSIGWKYKNLTIVGLSVLLMIFLSRIEAFEYFLLHLGNFGYFGAFIAGIFFVSMFTAASSGLILIILSQNLSTLEIALIAGMGAVVGDLLIFHLIKDNLSNEIKDIYSRIDKKNHLKNLLYSKYFNWMLPVIGAIIIASPIPDEIGISLMGLAKMKTVKFVIISFILNFIGLFAVVSAASLLF